MNIVRKMSVVIFIVFILSTSVLAGCNKVIGDATQLAEISPLEFNSIAELVQERKRVSGIQSDVYDLESITSIYAPSIFKNNYNGINCNKIQINKNYYAIEFEFEQSKDAINVISDNFDYHYWFTHIVFQVRRDQWSSQDFLEERLKKYPNEYAKIKNDNQDYFVCETRDEEGSDELVSKIVYWVANNKLHQISIPGNVSSQEMTAYFDLIEIILDE